MDTVYIVHNKDEWMDCQKALVALGYKWASPDISNKYLTMPSYIKNNRNISIIIRDKRLSYNSNPNFLTEDCRGVKIVEWDGSWDDE